MSKLTLSEAGFSAQIMQDVSFTEALINEAFVSQAALFAYYADQSRVATKTADNLKMRIDMVASSLDEAIRNKAATDGAKITEKLVEQAICRDDKYIKAVEEYNNAKSTAQMLRDTLEALKMKKDMLIQVGTNIREEKRVTAVYEAPDLMKQRRESILKKTQEPN
jgi:hypothetical protein